MDNLLIRCSSLHKIMGTPRKKGEILTETAKTYIESLVDQKEYEYNDFVETKQMQKGTINEDIAIELINELDFTDYKKNTIRLSNGFLTGECDIFVPDEDLIIDIKCSWTKKTFPKTKTQASKKIKKAGYDWQGVGYMMLWDVSRFKVSYCLTNTPDYLCEWEDYELHNMNDIPIEMRRTEVEFKRDLDKEEQVKTKVKQCRDYASFYLMQIRNRL